MKSPLFADSDIKRSLVLAGGGVRLAYHAGVIKALEEANISFNHVDGTSGGIFNTAMLASGLVPTEICNRWRRLQIFKFMSPTPLRNYLKMSRINAMGDADGIRESVFPTLGIQPSKINTNKEFETTFNVCNFSTKEIESISGHEVTENHLIAGMSLPIFMPAIKIKNDWYTDAVWVKDANLMEAVKRGAEEIFLVYCIGNSREYLEGSFLQYVHMIEMSASGGLLAEFDWLVEINKQILLGHSPYGQQKPVKLQVIKPKYPLPLDPDLFLGHIDVNSLINMGYAEAKEILNALPEKGVNLNFKAAQMNEPGISFQFLTRFSGPINFENIGINGTVNILFDFREISSDQIDSSFFGSIKFESNEYEISFFENKISILKSKIILSAKFLKDNNPHLFWAEIELTNKFDFLLGLGFKQMSLKIDEGKTSQISQNTWARMKGGFKSKIYENKGFFARMKSKTRILNWLYSN